MADIALDAQISPDESAASGASKLFFYLWNSAFSHAQGTLDGDADALHDMRVDLRRLRTTMSNFEGAKTSPLLSKKLRAEIRGARAEIGILGDKLGAVRDFDVLEDYVRDYAKKQLKTEVESAPGLLHLLETLQEERADAFKPMKKALARAQKTGDLREEFGRWALGIPGAAVDEISFREAAQIVLKTRINEVFSHESSLQEEANHEEQHELRKSLRRVRYTLETMSVAFAKPIKKPVKTLVEMQDTLGEMQDRAVLRAVTARVFGKNAPEDVAAFNHHGDLRSHDLLGATRTLWQKAQGQKFWDELRGF
ncbi:MAG TPA: CHAD domain-containing protein [Abditibacterium sp.]|jgi:CHAD domain-containing protein